MPATSACCRRARPRRCARCRSANRFFKGLSSWIDRFRRCASDYQPAPARARHTSWNAWTLIGFSIEGLTSFTVAPLRVATMLGLILAASALLFGGWIIVQTLLFGQDVPGYPSLVVGLMVLGGVQLLMIGGARRIYRQAAVRDQSPPGLFRRRTQREERRRDRQTCRIARGRVSAGRAVANAVRHIWLCADDYGNLARGQCRHSRTDPARAAQRDLGDDGGAAPVGR